MNKKKDDIKKKCAGDSAKPEAEKDAAQKTAEQLAEEYLNGWKRALADYENLKKETAKERIDFVKYAVADIVMGLLPALDYFETAIEHRPDLSKCDDDVRKRITSWLDGVSHIKKMLFDRLAEDGLVEVGTEGKFDTLSHEAVGEEESEGEAGTIIRVVQKGYRLRDRLLRPAKVIISKNKQKYE